MSLLIQSITDPTCSKQQCWSAGNSLVCTALSIRSTVHPVYVPICTYPVASLAVINKLVSSSEPSILPAARPECIACQEVDVAACRRSDAGGEVQADNGDCDIQGQTEAAMCNLHPASGSKSSNAVRLISQHYESSCCWDTRSQHSTQENSNQKNTVS